MVFILRVTEYRKEITIAIPDAELAQRVGEVILKYYYPFVERDNHIFDVRDHGEYWIVYSYLPDLINEEDKVIWGNPEEWTEDYSDLIDLINEKGTGSMVEFEKKSFDIWIMIRVHEQGEYYSIDVEILRRIGD